MSFEQIKKFEYSRYNIKHIFYNNNKKNDTLFISFAGKVDFYVNSTWFYKNDKINANFLFLKNDDNYDTYQNNNYLNLINYYISKYDIKKIITYGLSMGGIASIYYGVLLKADLIISIDPHPINYNIHTLYNLIDKTNFNFQKIFINYTFYDNSTKNNIPNHTNIIIEKLLLKNIFLTIQPYVCTKHLSFIPSKEYLINIISTLSTKIVENIDKNKNNNNIIL